MEFRQLWDALLLLPPIQGTDLKAYFSDWQSLSSKDLEAHLGTLEVVMKCRTLALAKKHGLIEDLEIQQRPNYQRVQNVIYALNPLEEN